MGGLLAGKLRCTLFCESQPAFRIIFARETGLYRGRPVDVAVMKDGSLLISDDFAGAIYRVTYAAP